MKNKMNKNKYLTKIKNNNSKYMKIKSNRNPNKQNHHKHKQQALTKVSSLMLKISIKLNKQNK